MKGLNQVFDGGGETYVGWPPLGTLWAGGALTCVKEEVEDAEEPDEQEENTESLSELELPEEGECLAY
jgi:hypothetical protein